MKPRHFRVIWAAGLVASLLFLPGGRTATAIFAMDADGGSDLQHGTLVNQDRPNARNSSPLEAFGQLPLTFERNEGQGGATTDFVSRGSGYTVTLNSTRSL